MKKNNDNIIIFLTINIIYSQRVNFFLNLIKKKKKIINRTNRVIRLYTREAFDCKFRVTKLL